MAKIWLIHQNELPGPLNQADIAIWPTSHLPSETQLRTWAGWAETPLIAGDMAAGRIMAFTEEPQIWPGADLAVGQGKIWRWQTHYIAWLVEESLAIPEISRALSLAGVSLIICSTKANSSCYLDPLWRAAQSCQLFGLAAGQATLYLPCELDPKENGIWPLEATEAGYLAHIPLEQIAPLQQHHPIKQGLRPALYKALSWWEQ